MFSLKLITSSLLLSLTNARAFPFPDPTDADGLAHGSEARNTMGPAEFLYPYGRQWTEETEYTPPCGTNAGVLSNRSKFALDDGFVAIVAKMEAYKVRLSISYNEDPQSQSDFEDWYEGNVTDDLFIGHTCFYAPELPSSINAGDVATIQLIYQNDDMDYEDEDGIATLNDKNQTFYVCADIVFVEDSVFDVSPYATRCFNYTVQRTTTYPFDSSDSTGYGTSLTTASGDNNAAATATATATASGSTSASSSTAQGNAPALFSASIVPCLLGIFAVAVNFV